MKLLEKEHILNESKRMLSISTWRRRLVFWGGGLSIGLICVVFAYFCDLINLYFEHYVHQERFLPLLVTPLGFMLIIWLLRRWFNGAEGSGIPQAMAALHLKSEKKRKNLVSLRIATGKFFLTMLGFAAGGSIGREGPTIQLSASIMQSLGKLGTFHKDDAEKGLILAGGAAGIAAAFNAPLAGIVFAIEELSGSFEKGVSGTIITTVVLCGIVAQYILGNYSYFGSSKATLDVLNNGWIVILTMAVAGGMLGAIFSRLLLKCSEYLMPYVKQHPIMLAGIVGLSVAIIGLVSYGTTYGSGYAAAKAIITDQHVDVPFLFGPLKFLATLLTYLSGIPGGIFAPSLSAGAGFGQIFSHFFSPQFHDAAVLLCTVAYFSGVVQSPITCFVIVLEMTDSASGNMVLPIMLTSVMATAVSKTICREPLYHALSQRYLSRYQSAQPVLKD